MQSAARINQGRYCACPDCAAIFSLPENKYQHKGGIVRCGACRRIFDANKNMVTRSGGKFVPISSADPVSHSPVTNPESQPERIHNPLSDANQSSKKHPNVAEESRFSSRNLEHHLNQASAHNSSHCAPLAQEQSQPFSGLPHGRQDATACFDDQSDDESDLKLANDGVKKSSPLRVNSKPGIGDTGIARMSRAGVDEYINDRKNPFSTYIWCLITIGFVVLLGVQVKYFFVDKLAQNESYRGYLSVFCSVASCQLPPRKDPSEITITHTKIDLHPSEPGALRVTVKMVNKAKFAQPFPALKLTLTDRSGGVVGRRTFIPAFYLPKNASDMLGEGALASPILFDFARPHEKAVGFVVDVVTEQAADLGSEWL